MGSPFWSVPFDNVAGIVTGTIKLAVKPKPVDGRKCDRGRGSHWLNCHRHHRGVDEAKKHFASHLAGHRSGAKMQEGEMAGKGVT